MAVFCSHIIMFTIYFNPIAIPSEVSQLYGIGTAEQQYGRMRRYRCIFCAAFGFSDIITGLNNCSDMFPPLKMVAGGILTFIELFEVSGSMYNTCSWIILADQTVLENKKELEDLEPKLEAILRSLRSIKTAEQM
jgi:hypothetical protein